MVINMGKKIVLLFISFILLFAEGITAFAWEKGQMIDVPSIDAAFWMDAIPDDAYISALNIPGAHDAGLSRARLGFGGVAQCQDLTIAEQLEAGVRFFDIRLRFGGDPDDFYDDDAVNENYICHGQGIWCCDGYKPDGSHYTYEDVLDEMASFIETHESETIFFFVRNEDYDKDDLEEDDCYRTVLEENENDIVRRFAAEGKEEDFVVLESANVPAGTMGDYRGKIVRFPNGIGFGDLMDEEKYNDFEASYADKWANIKPFFDSAKEQTFYIPKLKKIKEFRCAYTSCTGQYTYNEDDEKVYNNVGIIEQIPTGKDEAEEMNRLILDYPFIRGAYYGWIGMDMITEDLARTIFQTNDFNEEGMIIPEKVPTYIKDIAGFCDISYDDAVERCYAAGYTPIPAKVSSKGRTKYNINPEGAPIVLGYTTTTDPNSAITNIVGRYDSNIPGNYEKVIVYNSLYNFFTRFSDFGSEDTYLFVSRRKDNSPITDLMVMYTDEGTENGMVSRDLDGDKPVGSGETFNLQAGVEDDNDNEIFIGLKMIREDASYYSGSIIGSDSGNVFTIITFAGIIIFAVLYMIEKKNNNELMKKLKEVKAE